MARLLEYQGKEILRRFKILTPRGIVVHSADEAQAAAEQLGFPLAMKAQIYSGKRGKSGGVRMVATRAELMEVVTEMLGTPIHGLPVKELLLEQKLEIRQELYVGITADPSRRTPVVIVSAQGGVEIEETAQACPETVRRLYVDILKGLYVYEALDLLRGVSILTSPDKLEVARVICNLYEVFRRHDCHLVEINPLGLTSEGVFALDARMDIDDDAVGRQRDLHLDVAEEAGDRAPTPLEQIAGAIDQHDHRGSVHFVQIDPELSLARVDGKIPIGFNCVGAGASLTMMDELVPLGFYPVDFCDSSGNPVGSKLYRITKIIFSQVGIEGYVFMSCISSQQLDNTARGIAKALRELYPDTGGQPNIPTVLAFRGAWDGDAIRLLEETGIARGRWVRVLGREATEHAISETFRELHERWRAEVGGVR